MCHKLNQPIPLFPDTVDDGGLAKLLQDCLKLNNTATVFSEVLFGIYDELVELGSDHV